MTLYMTILEGERADKAKAILAVSDQPLIKCVLAEIGRWGTGGEGDAVIATRRRRNHRKEEAVGLSPTAKGGDQ